MLVLISIFGMPRDQNKKGLKVRQNIPDIVDTALLVLNQCSQKSSHVKEYDTPASCNSCSYLAKMLLSCPVMVSNKVQKQDPVSDHLPQATGRRSTVCVRS